MTEVFTFNKTYQERHTEYTNIFCDSCEVLSVSELQKVWALYLEITLDVCDWQAMWKIPRYTCEKLQVEFPSIVIVMVKSIDYINREANVDVVAVQGDLQLSLRHVVPLIQLWPTKNQHVNVPLNIKETANSIDALRFFYLHIFMPWDKDEEDQIDWFTTHFETRLKLHFDMCNGLIPKPTVEYINNLLNEARRLQARYEVMQDDDNDILDDDKPSQTVQAYVALHLRMVQIKNEIEILENPVLRNALLSQESEEIANEKINQNENWLVYSNGTIEDYVAFLDLVKNNIGNLNVKFVSTIILALENSHSGDKILLSNQGTHDLGNKRIILHNIMMKSVYSMNDTVLKCNNEDVMLDCNGDVILENLTISNVHRPKFAIVVRSGTLILRNCKIIGNNNSLTHQGIIVLQNGILKMYDCEISGFYTSIIGNTGSQINIKNSTISDSHNGVKVFENADITIENSTIKNSLKYGIYVESDEMIKILNMTSKTGDFELLSNNPKINIKKVIGEKNKEANVIITSSPLFVTTDTAVKKEKEYESSEDNVVCVNMDTSIA